MKYYISDTHLGHNNAIKYDKRPFSDIEEMDEFIIKQWNEKVGDKDEVFILGDFSFYKSQKTMEILKQLKGIKYLVCGNHDWSFMKSKDFDKTLFKKCDKIMHTRDGGKLIVMCHFPIQSWENKEIGSIHLHGHVHINEERDESRKISCIEKGAFNVGCMLYDYSPQTLKEIMQKEIF